MKKASEISRTVFASLAGLRLTLAILVALVLLSIAGAWIPQQDSAFNQALLEKYGTEGSAILKNSGLLNVYQSPAFIACNAMLFINLLACTVLRMSPRIKARLKRDDYKTADEIDELKEKIALRFERSANEATEELCREMLTLGYQAFPRGGEIIFEKGKWGWLAAPVTHLGLFVLMIGVTVSALYSYSGKIVLLEGQENNLSEAVDRQPIIGKVKKLKLRLVSTRKDSHSDGSPKQWFSVIEVEDESGKNRGKGEISVNSPWSCDNVDFCQSDWKIAGAQIRLGDNELEVPFEEMGHDSMGLIPVSENLLMVLALKDSAAPLRLYFKHSQSNMPKLFDTLNKGESSKDCPVPFIYRNSLLRSGISFKYDPGLPITYTAFFVLFCGSIFVARPSMRMWAVVREVVESQCLISIGFNGVKAAHSMRRDMRSIARRFQSVGQDECAESPEVSRVDC